MTTTTFDVNILGLSKLKKSFEDAPAMVYPILAQAIARSADILAQHTTQDDGVPYRTGQLMQTFRRDVQGLRARWFPTVKYAPYVELGHTQEVGRFVPAIGKRLVQPFVKGNPFMERIRGRSKAEIDDTFREALAVIIRALKTSP